MSGVPDFVSLCISEANQSKFYVLPCFGGSAFFTSYDPAIYVNTFGRSIIQISLLTSYRSVLADPKGAAKRLESDDVPSVVDEADVKVSVNPRGEEWEVMHSALPLRLLLESFLWANLTTKIFICNYVFLKLYNLFVSFRFVFSRCFIFIPCYLF